MHISRTRQGIGTEKNSTMQFLPFLFSQQNKTFQNKTKEEEERRFRLSQGKARTFIFPQAKLEKSQAHFQHNNTAFFESKIAGGASMAYNADTMHTHCTSQASLTPSSLQSSACPPPPQSHSPKPTPIHPLSQKDPAFILFYYDYEGCEHHVQCKTMHEAISWAQEEAEEHQTNVGIYQLVHTELAP